VKVNFPGRFQIVFGSVALLMSLLIPVVAAGQVPLIQFSNSSGVAYQKSVSVTLNAGQTAGDLNLVVVGWNDLSSTVASVTDTNNNTYVLAAGTVATPLPMAGADQSSESQAIYYAKSINPGVNTVTVTFNQFTAAQDIRIVEYGTTGGGLDAAFPLDTSSGASGTAGPLSSGAATTNSANDLIYGAGTITTAFTSFVKSCGTGCSLTGEPFPPGSGINSFGDLDADALVTAIGSYSVSGNFPGGAAVVQMVAMRESGQVLPVFGAPTTTLVAPATAPEAGGTPITITGTNFVQGATVIFTNGTITASAVDCAVASSTSITCLTPSFSTAGTTGLFVTNVDGQNTSAAPLAFTITASTPFTTAGGGSLSPDGGATNGGTFVTITGSDFAAGAKVKVGGSPADKVQVVNSNTIECVFPAGSAGGQDVVVTNPSGANGTLPGAYTFSTGAGINFIQANSAQPGTGFSAGVTFNLAQTAGDLNVVAIGWGDTTATIKSVSDSAGNTYAVAAAATQGPAITQAIYYAKNIAAAVAAGNTVTVSFNGQATTPDIRAVEYSGLDTANPLDGAGVGASGTGADLDSGPLTTTAAGDLFIGAGDVAGVITSPGGGFATAILSPYGNNVEHYFPTAAGSFDATAVQDINGGWVMQAAAFQQPAGAVAGFTVSATALAPASIAPGSSARSTVSVTPSGGFASAVMLSCSGLPTGATCTFATNPVTPGASAATSALTIATTAGTPNGSSTVTISGVSGSVTETTTVTLVVAASGSGGNFTLTANPTSQTVSPGSPGTSTITINPTGGFTGTVTLACNITTTASPAPVCSLPASATTTATLTVSTTGPTAALRHSSTIFYALLLPIGGMTLLGVSFGSRRKKVLGILLVFLMASGLLFLASCSSGSSSSGGGGGGGGGTPAGNYTVTVTGTSGSLTQTTTFTLTVQ